MGKQIAVLLNEDGDQTTSFEHEGKITLYQREEAFWINKKEIPINLDFSRGMREVRSVLKTLTDELGSCKIFVAEKLTGLAYNILEAKGYNVWEIKGKPEELLESVWLADQNERKREMVQMKEKKEKPYLQKEEEPGYYSLDLIALQKAQDVTSKQILIPFFKDVSFYELRLTCIHVPPWLEREQEKYNIILEAQQVEKGKYIVTIKQRICEESK